MNDLLTEVRAEVTHAADRYQQERGARPVTGSFDRVVMPYGLTAIMGRRYMRSPQVDPRPVVWASLRALQEELGRQADMLTRPRRKGGLGLDIQSSLVDPYGRRDLSQPYADRADLIIADTLNDVGENGRVQGLSTNITGGSESFSHPDTNDLLRIVHDVFGHLATGRGVDRHGEEAAYQHHRQMFSPLARLSLSRELREQNSYLHTYGLFPGMPKVGIAFDSPPVSPLLFGESYSRLLAESKRETERQGLAG